MQKIFIELARLSIATQQTVCRNFLDDFGEAGNNGVRWVEAQLDSIPFIPETHRRWMEEWVRIGNEGRENLQQNLMGIFEDADTLLNRLAR